MLKLTMQYSTFSNYTRQAVPVNQVGVSYYETVTAFAASRRPAIQALTWLRANVIALKPMGSPHPHPLTLPMFSQMIELKPTSMATFRGKPWRFYFLHSKKSIFSVVVPEFFRVCDPKGGAAIGAGIPAPILRGTTIGLSFVSPG